MVRASGDRSVAVGGNADAVVTGDGNTIHVVQAPLAPEPPSPEEVDNALAQYAQRLVQVYGRLDLEVLTPLSEEHPTVELREVFVAPTVRADLPPVELPRELLKRLVESGELPDQDAVPPGVDSTSLASLRESYLRRPAQEVLDVLAAPANRLLVLLGDPGAGKSTLVRYVGLALALGQADAPLAALSERVPLVVELRQYAEEQWRHSGFEDFLDHLHEDFTLSVPRPVLAQLLANGRALVVFDGLDELFDPTVRTRAAQRIAAFAARYPSARIVVTSRVIGYRRAVLEGAGFTHFMLQDLDEDRIRAFIRSWYDVACPNSPVQAGQLVERLTSAVMGSRPLQEMAGNPLLLTVLAIIGRRQTLPHNRRSVFEHAVTVLVSHWDQAAKLLKAPLAPPVAEALDVLGPDERLELLRLLARTMQEGHSGIAGNHIHASDLERVFRDYLQKYELPPVHATAAARAMVAQLHQRNFILSRYGGEVYGFVHRAFLEYLAAADIAQRYNDREWATPEELVEEVVVRRADDPAWHEVLLLLVGQLGTAATGTVVDRLLELHAGTADDDASHVALALRMLAETNKLGELSARSTAVVDAATRALDMRGRKGPWLLEEAMPALATFSPHWAGQRRFLRWFRISGQFSLSEEPTLVVSALRLGADELARLARLSYYSVDRMRFLYFWAQEHPADTTVYDLLRHTAAHDAKEHHRSAALDVMARLWHEFEDVHDFVTTRAQQDPDSLGRAEALATLAQVWPHHAESRGLVERAVKDLEVVPQADLARALGPAAAESDDFRRLLMELAVDAPDPHVRRRALWSLGKHCSQHQDVFDLVCRRVVDGADLEERQAATRVLGDNWSTDDRARRILLRQAADTGRPYDRIAALSVLGPWRPHDEEVTHAVLRAAADPDAPVRRASLDLLGNRRTDHYDLREVVLRLAATDPDAGVRNTAIGLIDRDRFDHGSGREVLAAAVDDTVQVVRDAALDQLARQWPNDPAVRDLLIRKATGDLSALTLSSVLEGLMAHWPDRDDVHQLVLRSIAGSTELDRGLLLYFLEDHWPDRDDVRAALIDLTRQPEESYDTYRYALHTLAKRWFDRDDVHEVVVHAVMDGIAPASSIDALREHWAQREDVRDLLVHVALHHTQDDARLDAVKTLGLHWPHHPDVQALFLRLSTDDTDADVRFTALRHRALTAHDDEALALAAARATADPNAEIRRQLLHLLALTWPTAPDTTTALRQCSQQDPDEETRTTADYLLGQLTH